MMTNKDKHDLKPRILNEVDFRMNFFEAVSDYWHCLNTMLLQCYNEGIDSLAFAGIDTTALIKADFATKDLFVEAEDILNQAIRFGTASEELKCNYRELQNLARFCIRVYDSLDVDIINQQNVSEDKVKLAFECLHIGFWASWLDPSQREHYFEFGALKSKYYSRSQQAKINSDLGLKNKKQKEIERAALIEEKAIELCKFTYDSQWAFVCAIANRLPQLVTWQNELNKERKKNKDATLMAQNYILNIISKKGIHAKYRN